MSRYWAPRGPGHVFGSRSYVRVARPGDQGPASLDRTISGAPPLNGQHDEAPMSCEHALPGGNITGAVRIGATVRRATGPNTPAIHVLLNHLAAVGFIEAPRVLGVDEVGREVLGYIEGESVGDAHPWPRWVWQDETLAHAGALLRRYHDAVRTFDGLDLGWAYPARDRGPGAVICHNDFAPYNVIYREGRLVGLIDWDLAGPALPEWDVAHGAWHWTPLFDPDEARVSEPALPTDVARRLRLFVDAYGLENRAGLVEVILERIQASIDGIMTAAAAGQQPYRVLLEEGHVDPMRAAINFIERVAPTLRRALA